MANTGLLGDRLDAGDGEGVDLVLEQSAQRVAEVRQPSLMWFPAIQRAMVATARGPLDEAERLADVALAEGQRGEAPLASFFHATQRATLDVLRGGETTWQEVSLKNNQHALALRRKLLPKNHPGMKYIARTFSDSCLTVF